MILMSNEGWTQTPNYMLDNMHLMKPAVFKVCMVVVRQTCGYEDGPNRRKEWDKLSTSRIMKLSGLSNRAVIDAVETAIAESWIERRPSGQYFEYRVSPVKKVHSLPKNEKSYENSSQVNEKTYEESSQVTYEESSQVEQTYENSSQEPMKIVHTQKKDLKENNNQGNGAGFQSTGDPMLDAAIAKQERRQKQGGNYVQDWQVDLNKKLPAKERLVIVEGLARMFGLTAKLNTDSKTLETFHRQSVSLFEMGYTTLEQIECLFNLWMTDEWRRKNKDKITIFKFTDFASQRKEEEKQKESRPKKVIKIYNQYTGQNEERVIG